MSTSIKRRIRTERAGSITHCLHALYTIRFALSFAAAALTLAAALGVLAGPAQAAPGHAAPGAQDRVGAFFSAAPNCIREVAAESSCKRPGSTGSTARLAVGCWVAAKAEGIIAKDGTEITGYTRHGINRAIGDGAQDLGVEERAGTAPHAILDALRNPTKVKDGVDALGRPYKVYTGANARVVVNPETGQIISTNPLGGAGVRGGQ